MTTEELIRKIGDPNMAPTPELMLDIRRILSALVALAEKGENVQANWSQTDNSKPDYIKNKPSIPAAQIQSDWKQNDNTKPDYIKNKPGASQFIAGTFNSDNHVFTPDDDTLDIDTVASDYDSGITIIAYDTDGEGIARGLTGHDGQSGEITIIYFGEYAWAK